MAGDGDGAGVAVQSLFLYPVKSCAGIPVAQACITPTGFLWDRQWMVVNAESGRFLSQRQEPRLALVKTSLPPEAPTAPAWGQLPPDASLVLSAPGMPPLHLPLALEAYSFRRHVAVWEWSGEALDAGPDAASWFSTFLGRSCRVVRFHTGHAVRPTDEEFALGHETAFSDGFPFLVISQASLDSLNSHLPSPLLINRFRPNILVQGCPAFQEDCWKAFRIGTVPGRDFHGVKPCGRCKVTTVDQETAEGGKEPLQTLRDFRSGELLRLPKPFTKAEVFFGMNTVCRLEPGSTPSRSIVSVGDAVTATALADSARALVGA